MRVWVGGGGKDVQVGKDRESGRGHFGPIQVEVSCPLISLLFHSSASTFKDPNKSESCISTPILFLFHFLLPSILQEDKILLQLGDIRPHFTGFLPPTVTSQRRMNHLCPLEYPVVFTKVFPHPSRVSEALLAAVLTDGTSCSFFFTWEFCVAIPHASFLRYKIQWLLYRRSNCQLW